MDALIHLREMNRWTDSLFNACAVYDGLRVNKTTLWFYYDYDWDVCAMRITEGLHTYGARLHAQKPKQSKSHDDISDSTIFEFVYHLNYYAENL